MFVSNAPASTDRMPQRIARLDWATTPLGPRARWSRTLCVAVDMMLALPQPAYIGWGPTLVSLYNDAYVPVLGIKHPDALGRSYYDVWQEIDADYREALDATLGGRAQMFVDEPMALAGRGRDISWFTFSWTPLRDEDGAIAGFLAIGHETTEKVLVEHALQESEARARLLVGALAQATWETDAQGLVTVDSPSWRAYTGQTIDEWLGWGWLDAVHPDDRAYAGRQWADAVATRSNVDAKFRLRDAGGGWRWTNVRAMPLLGAHGRVRKWLGVNIDIDASTRTQQALHESEQQLAAELARAKALQSVSGLLIADGERSRLYEQILDAAIAIMGADMGSMQLMDARGGELHLIVFRGFHPEAAAYWQRVSVATGSSCGAALSHGARVIIEDVAGSDVTRGSDNMRYWKKSGIVAVQSTPLSARDGSIIGMLSTHWRRPHRPEDAELRSLDVLARQAADFIERARTQAALRESENKYRSLFESIDEGFLVYEMVRDGDGRAIDFRLLEVNPAFTRQTGLGQETVGKYASEFLPNLERFWIDTYDRVARTGAPERVEEYNQATERRYNVHVAAVHGKDRVAVVFEDVTERRRAERTLRASEDRKSFLLTLSDALRPLADPIDVQNEAARVLGAHVGAGRAAYADIGDDGACFTVHRDYTDGLPSFVGRYPVDGYGGPEMWAELRAGRTVSVADAERDARLGDADRRNYAAGQVRAAVAVPLVKDGRLSAVFFLHFPTPQVWSAERLSLVEETAERT